MKYNKLLSYCLKRTMPENMYQFHYTKTNGEPTTLDWDNWIAGILYSNIHLSFFNKQYRQIDLSSAKDKKKQLRDFLEYHYSKYGDICFLFEIKELIEYAKIAFANHYQIVPNYMEFVNSTILNWCKEKEQEPISTIPLIIDKSSNNPIFKDLLINISDKDKIKLLERLTEISQSKSKPKEFAIILVALSQMGYIELAKGNRNTIYRAIYNKEFVYKSKISSFVSGINYNIQEKGNVYSVMNSNQSDIDIIINALK